MTKPNHLGQQSRPERLKSSRAEAVRSSAWFAATRWLVQRASNLTPGWFVNHNENDPNLIYNSEQYCYFAARDIAVGEELTANYQSYSDNII